MKGNRIGILLAILAFVAAACNESEEPLRKKASGGTDGNGVEVVSSAENARERSPGFSVTELQARQVATIIAFLDAYNAARLDAALALLGEDVSFSDCNYRAVEPVDLVGKRQVAAWLKNRFKDNDRLLLRRILTGNPRDKYALAVEYERRTSDTLSALGFGEGVKPPLATKVLFSRDGRIRAFANGPVGGSPELCRPRTE